MGNGCCRASDERIPSLIQADVTTMDWTRIANGVRHEIYPLLASNLREVVKTNTMPLNDESRDKVLDILSRDKHLPIEERKYLEKFIQRARDRKFSAHKNHSPDYGTLSHFSKSYTVRVLRKIIRIYRNKITKAKSGTRCVRCSSLFVFETYKITHHLAQMAGPARRTLRQPIQPFSSVPHSRRFAAGLHVLFSRLALRALYSRTQSVSSSTSSV